MSSFYQLSNPGVNLQVFEWMNEYIFVPLFLRREYMKLAISAIK